MKIHLTILAAALIVAGSVLEAAHKLKPLTPSERCWDIRTTWERQVNEPMFSIKDAPDQTQQSIVHIVYWECLAASKRSGGR